MKNITTAKRITPRDSDSLNLYLKEVSREKLINQAKEIELAKRIKAGDQSALDELVKANLRFVITVAKQYQGRGLSLEDLIAEGNIGMIKAIKKFNLAYDIKFFSYAVWWIRQSMQALVKKTQITNSVEKGDDDLNSTIKENGINDIEDEVVNKKDVIMSNEEDEFRKEVEKNQKFVVNKLLVGLDGREKTIIEQYYGLNGEKEQNLEEIGIKLGITKERVRQIKKRILFRMRSEVLCMDNVEMLFR